MDHPSYGKDYMPLNINNDHLADNGQSAELTCDQPATQPTDTVPRVTSQLLILLIPRMTSQLLSLMIPRVTSSRMMTTQSILT